MISAEAKTTALVAAAILRSDLYSFIRVAFPIVSSGQRFLPNWHIEAMAYALEQVLDGHTKRLIITVPPRSLKSICASVCLPAFALGRDPMRRIICVSYSDLLAKKHANDCRALMHSALFRFLFPATRISPAKDSETEFMTTKRGSRLATSVGGTLTGRGGSLVIVDDALKPQDANSQSAREALKQWYGNTLLSRLDHKQGDAIVVVMQRLHPDDLVGHLIEQGGWTHLNLPAIAEENSSICLGLDRHHLRTVGELLHPEREPQAALDELRASMGSMQFAAQYQQAPIPAGGNLIRWSWFQFYEAPPPPQRGDRIIVSWDTALSTSESADYSVGMVFLVRGDAFYLLDLYRERPSYPDLKRKILEYHARWKSTAASYALLIEDKGSGQSLIQDLRYEKIFPIGVKPTADKVTRMAAQTPRLEGGALHLPRRAAWLDEFQKEVLAFPQGRHDDQIDALSQALDRASIIERPTATFGIYSAFG